MLTREDFFAGESVFSVMYSTYHFSKFFLNESQFIVLKYDLINYIVRCSAATRRILPVKPVSVHLSPFLCFYATTDKTALFVKYGV